MFSDNGRIGLRCYDELPEHVRDIVDENLDAHIWETEHRPAHDRCNRLLKAVLPYMLPYSTSGTFVYYECTKCKEWSEGHYECCCQDNFEVSGRQILEICKTNGTKSWTLSQPTLEFEQVPGHPHSLEVGHHGAGNITYYTCDICDQDIDQDLWNTLTCIQCHTTNQSWNTRYPQGAGFDVCAVCREKADYDAWPTTELHSGSGSGSGSDSDSDSGSGSGSDSDSGSVPH